MDMDGRIGVPPGLPLSFSPALREALVQGQAVVALESTLIAHGLPQDRALEAAQALEDAVREAGAVPATIAVLDGRIRIGLSAADLERLAASGPTLPKLGRRDLAPTMARGGDGATTVSATLACAALAGLSVFATGGIGGVHRGAETSFDISADLDELARTPVCVVSAGAKAVLDLPRTLEYLETRGVPVIGWQTDSFPAFWSPDSGLPLAQRVDDTETLARTLRIHWQISPGSGVLVAAPIPVAEGIPAEEIESLLASALAAAAHQGCAGPALTPFLLSHMARASAGRTVAANLALACNNARVAAGIAVALAAVGRTESRPRRSGVPALYRP